MNDEASNQFNHHSGEEPRQPEFCDLGRGFAFQLRSVGTDNAKVIFRQLLLQDIHHIVNGDDADEAVIMVNDWQCQKVVAGENVSDFFLILFREDENDTVRHDVTNQCVRRRG
ncbi:hypothetical protein HRbin17_02556 [bacterium HR17]|uniref:Uncharacterized protein n=1 Tax=Candidatus Fervidibacter japonicus TaxID=2035412 RepID=A0A2H5XFS8_9BACT|nr:hypothetical protein HRbin17_02556 [bacterium HR17]